MKNFKVILKYVVFLFPISINAQWQTQGGFVLVNTKTFLTADADIEIQSGTLTNKGTVNCLDLVNTPSGNLRGTGFWELNGNLENDGSLLDNSKFEMVGSAPATVNSPGSSLYSLTLDKNGAGTEVALAAPLSVRKILKFTGVANKLALGNHDFTLLTGATVSAANTTKYLITNGLGKYRRPALGAVAFTFHVGFNATTYNPIIVVNTGTADEIAVRILENALAAGNSGAPLTADAAATSWEITEAVPGGSSLDLTAQWRATDELPGFTRATCSVRRWDGSAWDSSPLGPPTGTGTATNLYKRVRTGVTDVGYFAVLDGNFPVSKPAPRAENGAAENQFLKNETFEIYPNPFDNQLVVSVSEVQKLEKTAGFSVKIFDATGRLTTENHFPAGEKQLKLNTENWQPGLHFIQILSADGNNLKTIRAVKTR